MKPQDPNSREAGFTLIELLIVVSVVAILAAAAVVNAKRIKEKALIAQGIEAARCLQTTLVGIDTMPPEEQAETFHKLGGSVADFNATARDLGCNLGPATTFDPKKQILTMDECRVVICKNNREQVRIEDCETFDPSTLGPFEEVCLELRFAIPHVPGKRIRMTDEIIRVEKFIEP